MEKLVDRSSWRFATSGVYFMENIHKLIEIIGCNQILDPQKVSCITLFRNAIVCNSFNFQFQVDKDISHVIVTANEDMEAYRSLFLAQAVAMGIPVICSTWVSACLRDNRELGEILKYEVRDAKLGVPGSRRSREALLRGDKPLMDGIQVLVRDQLFEEVFGFEGLNG